MGQLYQEDHEVQCETLTNALASVALAQKAPQDVFAEVDRLLDGLSLSVLAAPPKRAAREASPPPSPLLAVADDAAAHDCQAAPELFVFEDQQLTAGPQQPGTPDKQQQQQREQPPFVKTACPTAAATEASPRRGSPPSALSPDDTTSLITGLAALWAEEDRRESRRRGGSSGSAGGSRSGSASPRRSGRDDAEGAGAAAGREGSAPLSFGEMRLLSLLLDGSSPSSAAAASGRTKLRAKRHGPPAVVGAAGEGVGGAAASAPIGFGSLSMDSAGDSCRDGCGGAGCGRGSPCCGSFPLGSSVTDMAAGLRSGHQARGGRGRAVRLAAARGRNHAHCGAAGCCGCGPARSAPAPGLFGGWGMHPAFQDEEDELLQGIKGRGGA